MLHDAPALSYAFLLASQYKKSKEIPTVFSALNERVISNIQYYECKVYGHLACHWKKMKQCSYCRRSGHIISECAHQPQRQFESGPRCRVEPRQAALQAQIPLMTLDTSSPHLASMTMTSDQIKDMIQNSDVTSIPCIMGFSCLLSQACLLLFSYLQHSTWWIDSGASNLYEICRTTSW